MSDLLIELFSEEIPARMQARAAEDFQKIITDKLTAAGLSFTHAEAHVTPRRLMLAVAGIPDKQADVKEERKGPRVGSPEGAVQGFLKASGLSSLDQAEQRDTGKGVFYFAVTEIPGRATVEALPALIEAAIHEMPWPKSMRWGAGSFRWVRPLHSIIALFGGKVLEGGIDLGAGKRVAFGNVTRGHRFMAPDAFEVTSYDDYKARLKAASVVLDREERKRIILEGATALATKEGFRLRQDQGLLEEVAGLVEYPVALIGTIDQAFMDVPAEVLTTSMRLNQKYFALETADGALAPRFVVIANRTTIDGGKAVVAGNERVLRARLSDAKFFWDADRKASLEGHFEALKAITFHDKLGSVADKVGRVEALAVKIAALIGADEAQARRAAHLTKCDLVTGVVGEFPEVQGVAGRSIALAQGEPAPVAHAIADHYKPLGPSDTCPTAPVSVAVSLAEKLDTLASFFAIDEKPTGSRDPFALRRAALGVIRLVVENGLRLHLLPLMQNRTDLLDFFADRLTVVLREKGVRHDLISAVFALGGEDDLVRLLARVEALDAFLKTEDGADLVAAYRRASNIVRIEEKKDGKTYAGATDAALLQQDEEKALDVALTAAQAAAEKALATEDFTAAMAAVATLRAPVDAFFDKVTVNAPDAALRVNRLSLLSRIRATLDRVADFGKIEG